MSLSPDDDTGPATAPVSDTPAAGAFAPPAGPRYPMLAWLRAGARTAVMLPPRWDGLATGPAMIAVLFVLNLALAVLVQRLYIDGPAIFYWPAFNAGWLSLALLPWCAWLVRGDTPRLFTMLQAQSIILTLLVGAVYVAMIHGHLDTTRLGRFGNTAVWLAPPALALISQLVLLWRGGSRDPLPSATAILVLIGCFALNIFARPADFWYPKQQESAEPYPFKLTQELAEAQPALLAKQLAALRPQRPGKVDMYALTFAPYYADVFWRESGVVADVMAKRFDADGRVLQMVNHFHTAGTQVWATPLNLHRAIDRIARTMDRDEDILFLHLTSHGGANGHLTSQFPPLSMQDLTPQDLKKWLDEAGIRNRVISISACYSGSWIAPLANENTLVMTAADADHTSYGCGSKSELTFFGRAMYDEQLRNSTRSFEEAHAAARKIILQREQEAGKTDGYSNPQISVGSGIRARLARMQGDQL